MPKRPWSRYDPAPDVRDLLRRRDLSIAAAERAAGMCRGSLSRVLSARRGKGMRLSTAERLAEVLHVSLGTFAASLRRTTDEIVERRRMVLAAELARLQAE